MRKKDVPDFIKANKPVGYWSELGGVEVYLIEDTPDGIYFYCKAGLMGGKPTYHKTKVWVFGTDGGHKDNIRIYNKRLYLKDCLRL